VREKTSC